MTAQVIQFIPRPNPNRAETLEQMAVETFNAALLGDFNAAINHDKTIYESSLGYVAPENDSA